MGHIFMFTPVLALVLFIVLPWPAALITYLPITLVSLVFAYKGMKAQYQPPISGQEAMIGTLAVVVSSDAQSISVRCQGEVWQAVSERPLQRHQQVMVENVAGLTLHVTPLN